MIEILHGARETIVYDENMSVKPYYNDENENFPNHWQPSFEVIMPLKNIYTIYIEDNPIVLQPYELLIISPGMLHRIIAPDVGVRYIMLFDPVIFSGISGLETLNTMFHPYAHYTNQNSDCLSSMNGYMDNIYSEYAGKDPLKYASIYSNLLNLIVTAMRNKVNNIIDTSSPANSKSHKSHKYINKFLDICRYMEDNCMEDITIEKLAGLSGFSESHFIRLFKQFTSITYYDYLNQCRINRAKHLLATEPNLSVTDISLQSGFSSIATFNRLFKKQVKCSPTQYRSLQTI